MRNIGLGLGIQGTLLTVRINLINLIRTKLLIIKIKEKIYFEIAKYINKSIEL